MLEGNVDLTGRSLSMDRGNSLMIREDRLKIRAPDTAGLVLFLLDEQSVYSRSGAYSG